MAGATINIILLAVVSVATAATCTLDSITWSCSATPHLTLKFSKVTVTECDEINTKDAFKTLLSISYTGKNIDQGKTYTAVMVDPDAPKHANGEAWLHWIRSGLMGKDLVDGTMLTGQDIMEYAPPTPPKETGIHRYFVFLFEETNPVTATKDLVRRKFHLATFAEENKLCGPVASNMFRTQY
ncbi:phosphatidylethanolamine-binding protein 1-like isoform X2 [Portunus trituberculatus]|uniref:phosphatidylethanolamine-binding protein 1-like isoform X2 n=1 Tax=Portunus trituberculatus TaxID=210409 RepID=UPI001E1D1B5E|nr:phosphatidylethanolamine-binding protein 1-like isoform X2 [Portunus trituberculatus]